MSNRDADPPDHDPADRALVQAYLRDRGEAEFRTLYRRHGPALYRMAWRLVGEGQAEDMVQETWCRAAARMAEFKWRSTLRTWLTGILVRCCRESWRAHADVVALPVETVSEEPEVETGSYPTLDVERALSALSPGFREVLVLHDIEGFTHAEIARALGIVPGTSKSQLARARRALRQRLETSALPAVNGGKGS